MHQEGLTLTQESLCNRLFKIGAIKFDLETGFKLKLHDEHPEAPRSPIYIDLRMLRRYPDAKKKAVAVYEELIRPLNPDLLADIPTAATPLVSSLSDAMDIGMITPRTDSKTHGSGAKIDGYVKEEDEGKRVVLIDDLITQADSKLPPATILKEAGLIVEDIVVLIDREQGGEAILKNEGYRLHKAFTMDQMLKYYLRNGQLSQEQYDETLAQMKTLKDFQKSLKK